MEQEILYTLTVPATAEALPVLEGLCETFIREGDLVSHDIALILRLSVTEACQNALSLKARRGRLNVVTLFFLGNNGALKGAVGLEIRDSGSGLPIDGHLPPYPSAMLGKEIVLDTLLDQEVVARIETPLRVALFSREVNDGAEMLTPDALNAAPRQRGFGLLALCRCWKSVVFSYDPEHGTSLRLEQPMRSF